jgi:hypothetical protein
MPDDERAAIATAARRRVLRSHTSAGRAEELEAHVRQAQDVRPGAVAS